jgi:hypothetical protein
MIVTRQRIIELMHRLGMSDQVPEALKTLPDPVDLRRDAAVLQRFGLGLESVIDRMGGSP